MTLTHTAGAGNILLCDGTVQQVTSRDLYPACLKPALDAIPSPAPKTKAAIRLVFP